MQRELQPDRPLCVLQPASDCVRLWRSSEQARPIQLDKLLQVPQHSAHGTLPQFCAHIIRHDFAKASSSVQGGDASCHSNPLFQTKTLGSISASTQTHIASTATCDLAVKPCDLHPVFSTAHPSSSHVFTHPCKSGHRARACCALTTHFMEFLPPLCLVSVTMYHIPLQPHLPLSSK